MFSYFALLNYGKTAQYIHQFTNEVTMNIFIRRRQLYRYFHGGLNRTLHKKRKKFWPRWTQCSKNRDWCLLWCWGRMKNLSRMLWFGRCRAMDARALDSEKYRRSINRWTRQPTKATADTASIRLRVTAQAVCCKVLAICIHRLPEMRRLRRLPAKAISLGRKGVDVLYMHFNKANEFLGTTRPPTFLCNDQVKNPQVEKYLADYQAHLEKAFH